MTEKNIESKHHLERLDNRAAQLDQTCKNIQTRVENNTIETEKEQNLINERTSHLLENLNATQNRLETENRDLKQTVKDMQENNQQKLNNIETENRKLRNIIAEVKKDYKKLQNAYGQINRELTKLQAATLTTCDGDWGYFNGHCYLAELHQLITWDDASAYCSSNNSYLLEITTDTEREFVTEFLRDNRYWFWVGATDKDTTGSFIYYHSNLPIPENYWGEGAPDNSGGNQHCVYMYDFYTRSGVVELDDYSCTSRRRFVCEKSAA